MTLALISISYPVKTFRGNEPHQFAVAGIRILQFDEREPALLAHDAPAADEDADRLAEIRLMPDEHKYVQTGMIE